MLSDFFNPILVRDCRQMVQNRAVVSMIGLFLTGMVYAVYDVFLAEAHTIAEGEQGRALFWRVFLVMSVGTLATVLFSTTVRACSERLNDDPMFLTLITPRQIVWGKLVGGVVISLLFYCMALPFLSLVYLLRGVDLAEIFLGMLGSFLLIQSLNAFCLAFFAGVRSPVQCGVMLLGFLAIGGFYGFFAFLCAGSSWYGTNKTPAFIYAVVVLIAWAAMFVPITASLLAIAQYSPPSSNRMFATRLFVTVCGISLVPIIIMEHSFHDNLGGNQTLPLVMLLAIGGAVVMIFMNLIAICERDEYSWRQIQETPKNFWLRLLKFPLSSGSVNAFCWIFLATAFLCLASTAIIHGPLPMDWRHMGVQKIVFAHSVFAMFVFDYSATAYWLHRAFLHRWIPRNWAWTLPPLLMLLVAFATIIFGLLIDKHLYNFNESWRISDGKFQQQILWAPNALTVFLDFNGYRTVQTVCAFGWAAVLVLLGVVWWFCQRLRFSRAARIE